MSGLGVGLLERSVNHVSPYYGRRRCLFPDNDERFPDVAAGLTDSDLSSLNVSPNFSFFPFMELVQNMVGGLWAMSLYIAIAAWICAAIAWIMGRVIHSGPMQQYSGTVFIWCALATMILGSSMAIVKFFATQALF